MTYFTDISSSNTTNINNNRYFCNINELPGLKLASDCVGAIEPLINFRSVNYNNRNIKIQIEIYCNTEEVDDFAVNMQFIIIIALAVRNSQQSSCNRRNRYYDNSSK